MQIHVTADRNSQAKTVIFPLLKVENMQETLQKIADLTGASADNLNADFSGDKKETHTFYDKNNRKIFLLGLGDRTDSNAVLQTCRSFVHHRRHKLAGHLSIDLSFNETAAYTTEILTGMLLGTYDINFYQTKEKKDVPLAGKEAQIDIFVDKSQIESTKKAADRAEKNADTLRNIFDLINRPANKKRPQDMAEFMVKRGEKNGFSVRVMEKPEIEKIGLGGLLAVNRGSEDPARFIVMEHKPQTDRKVKTVALVGKGVTFDTGGLSIKPSSNMHLMKSDMGGSGAVVGAMEMTAKLQLPVHLIAVVGATDNSVDALSYKPSDVITTYSGKTVEIIDTDAEGRMTLADGLAYVNEIYKPDVMIDVATLTGSVIRALGYEAGGLFTKSEKLAADLIKASEETGEKLWQMPMWDSYAAMIKSDVADVRNYSGKPIAGSITAAKFLENFTSKHPHWAHVDIAGTSVTANEFGSDRSATGFGVRLLLRYIESVCEG